MAHEKKKEKAPSSMEKKLARLEETAAGRGIRIHYDRLEAAGLRLQGGICKVRGECHLFIDKRKPLAERLGLLKSYLKDGAGTRDVNREDVPGRSYLRRHKDR